MSPPSHSPNACSYSTVYTLGGMSFFIGCGMVLHQGDSFVLVQETYGIKKGLHSLPGGTLELQEDLIACLKREVKEETGVDVAPDCFIGLYQYVLEDGHNILFFVFGGEVAPDAVFTSEEHEVIRAYTFDEIMALDKKGGLRASTVLQSIKEYRAGTRYPLSIFDSQYLPSLGAITVTKD